MKLMRTLLLSLAFSLLVLFLAKITLASQYGEEVIPGRILIDKKVSVPNVNINRPQDAEYVDNLFDFNPRFKPSQLLFFKLKTKNVSNVKLTGVQIRDFFPASFIETIGGSGTLERIDNQMTIVINIGDLQPDEERIDFIQMRVLSQDRLPNSTLFCGKEGVINKVKVTGDRGSADEDTAQFCIEKEVITTVQVPAKTVEITTQKGFTAAVPVKVPSAGPEMNIILISGELLALAAGIYLKKLS